MSCSWIVLDGVAPEPDGRLGQLEAAALIDSADDEQRRHGPDSRVLSSNSSILRINEAVMIGLGDKLALRQPVALPAQTAQ